MSVEIWPPIAPEHLKTAVETSQVSPISSLPQSFNIPIDIMAIDLFEDWELIDSPFVRRPPRQKRELDWLVQELRETLTNLKHGLEDCYALLAPVDPGSTLVLSTPRNEIVKGHITRVGTRIVKGVRYPLSLLAFSQPQLTEMLYRPSTSASKPSPNKPSA